MSMAQAARCQPTGLGEATGGGAHGGAKTRRGSPLGPPPRRPPWRWRPPWPPPPLLGSERGPRGDGGGGRVAVKAARASAAERDPGTAHTTAGSGESRSKSGVWTLCGCQRPSRRGGEDRDVRADYRYVRQGCHNPRHSGRSVGDLRSQDPVSDVCSTLTYRHEEGGGAGRHAGEKGPVDAKADLQTQRANTRFKC